MLRNHSLTACVLAVGLFAGLAWGDDKGSLNATLTPYLKRHQLPALAAAVVKEGKVIAAGAVGTRRAGTTSPVTLDDRFHIGSDTKAMTALLAGMLVEEGKLRWSSTVAELFPELAKEIHPDLQGVTLTQLLSHTSGIPSDDEAFDKLLEASLTQDGNLDELRYWTIQRYVTRPLAAKPGEKFAYANMNYMIVGSAIERNVGQTWEELITERVFAPLGLKSAGLGPQSSLGRVDAPLGHLEVDGKAKAYLAGPNGDNPLVMGPAGTVHMSVLDFARWASWNAGGAKRGPALVRPETRAKLHEMIMTIPAKKDAAPGTPALGQYGLGWGQVHAPWASGPMLYHGGSNTKNLAHIWVDPKHDFAMVLMTNIGGKSADEAFRALAETLYTQFAGSKAHD